MNGLPVRVASLPVFDVNGLPVRVASLPVFDVNRLPVRVASLPVFDVNRLPVRVASLPVFDVNRLPMRVTFCFSETVLNSLIISQRNMTNPLDIPTKETGPVYFRLTCNGSSARETEVSQHDASHSFILKSSLPVSENPAGLLDQIGRAHV